MEKASCTREGDFSAPSVRGSHCLGQEARGSGIAQPDPPYGARVERCIFCSFAPTILTDSKNDWVVRGIEGYADLICVNLDDRTASQPQGADTRPRSTRVQENLLGAAIGCQGERPQLTAANGFLRPGDEPVATKIDRLARSVGNLCAIIDQVRAKGASPMIPQLGSTDPNTSVGGLLVNILGTVAEFERVLMLEQEREGISAAKQRGACRGRKPTAMARPVKSANWSRKTSARPGSRGA